MIRTITHWATTNSPCRFRQPGNLLGNMNKALQKSRTSIWEEATCTKLLKNDKPLSGNIKDAPQKGHYKNDYHFE